jgi:hypothetical protein
MRSVLQKAWLGLSDKSRYPFGFRFSRVSFRFRFFLRLLMKETEAEDFYCPRLVLWLVQFREKVGLYR